MNIRIRQQMRAVNLQQNLHYWPGTLIGDDGFLYAVFIPVGEEAAYKEAYGQRLDIWFYEPKGEK